MPLSKFETALLTGSQLDNADKDELRELINLVVDGNFEVALHTPLALEVLTVDKEFSATKSMSDGFQFHTRFQDTGDEEKADTTTLAIAVGCLHAFLQQNWTGPDVNIDLMRLISAETDSKPTLTNDKLERLAISELSLNGEPAYHLMKLSPIFRIAQLLLRKPLQSSQSAPWWRRRCAAVHQRLLEEATALPDDWITPIQPILDAVSGLSVSQDLAGQAVLEDGLLNHHSGKDKLAYASFSRAAEFLGLDYELTGVLGKRTRFQISEHSQLVLLAASRDRGQQADSGISEKGELPVPETLALNDDTLLEKTAFADSQRGGTGRLAHVDPNDQPSLHPLDQCVLLGMCLNVQNTSPSHGLTSEQMMPYVQRVLSHPRNWSIHTMGLLLRSRLEANRTRTVERSTLQLAQLVEQMPSNDSSPRERLVYFHSLLLPSKWELQKELALRYMSLGIVKSALEIFEKLEMWEDVVKCWSAVERPDKGVLIVKELLAGQKEEADTATYRSRTQNDETRRRVLDSAREAKLWCLLGDLEPEHAEKHYNHAWSVSGEKSGRAMRSLGGYYFARNNYAAAALCLKRAVSINPLQSRSWFVLGCAHVREENWQEARDAFSRCVAIDDEDGESWNNLASVYLRLPRVDNRRTAQEDENDSGIGPSADTSPLSNDVPPIPIENKLLAFQALKQGLKFSYENWRMWSNYMLVAMDVGEFQEACRALGHIVEQKGEKLGSEIIDEEVVEKLVDASIRSDEMLRQDALVVGQNEGAALRRRVFDLIERIILPKVSSSQRIYRAYTRLLMSESRWQDALDSGINAYRLTLAGSGESILDAKAWKNAVSDVQDVVDLLRNIGPRTEGSAEELTQTSGSAPPRWQGQCRSVLRSFLGRTKRDFEDEPEYGSLKSLLSELKSDTIC